MEMVDIKEEIVEGVEFELEDLHHAIDVKEETAELGAEADAVMESKPNLVLCKSESTLNSLLIKPEVVPVSSQIFACSICEKKFAHKSSLKNHLTIHTGVKPFACLICDYRSARRDALNDHVKVHTGEKPFGCKICTYKGSTRQNLNQHMVTHISEKKFLCVVCNYRTVTKERMKSHNRIHSGEKPFVCVICGYRFSCKQHMTEHMKTHTNEKPFVCNICGFSCKLKDYLRRHMRTHARGKLRRNLEKQLKPAEKPFPGVIKCLLKQNLKQYTIPERRFGCKICGYKCMLQSTLTDHLRIHDQKSSFTTCQMSYSECAQTSQRKCLLSSPSCDQQPDTAE